MADGAERTLPATPHRREQARREGRVAVSQELTRVAGLAGGVVGLWLAAMWAPGVLRRSLESLWLGSGLPGREFMALVAALAGPPAGLAALLALAGGLAQAKGARRPLRPAALGLRMLFSFQNVVAGLRGLAAAGLLGAVLASAVARALEAMPGSTGEGWAGFHAAGLILDVLARGTLALGAIALGDLAYRLWQHERDLRMSPQELREELKETEGNPQVRRAQRRRMQDLARRRSVAEAARATVLITNPVHVAVALRWVPGRMPAPRVTAKGEGELAARMRRAAEEHGVPVVSDPPLARALYRAVPVGRAIPPAFYRTVAEILAAVWRSRRA